MNNESLTTAERMEQAVRELCDTPLEEFLTFVKAVPYEDAYVVVDGRIIWKDGEEETKNLTHTELVDYLKLRCYELVTLKYDFKGTIPERIQAHEDLLEIREKVFTGIHDAMKMVIGSPPTIDEVVSKGWPKGGQLPTMHGITTGKASSILSAIDVRIPELTDCESVVTYSYLGGKLRPLEEGEVEEKKEKQAALATAIEALKVVEKLSAAHSSDTEDIEYLVGSFGRSKEKIEEELEKGKTNV